MPIERTKNASRNIIWGAFNKFVSLVLPFISRTVIIYQMGMQYVGLGSLFNSILQVLSFAELGIGGAMVYSMYKPIADNDDAKVCALLNLYKKIYRIIGLIILGLGVIIMPFINRFVSGDVPDNINLKMLFVIYLINNVAGYFLFAYKQSVFTASQRVDYISKIQLIVNATLSISQITLICIFKNYYLYVIVVPLFTCINNIILGITSDKMFPNYKCVGIVEKNEINEIKKKVGGMLFQKIGNIILTSVDTIVISSFLGLKILGIYNGYYYIITALFGFLAVIQQSLIPSIGNSTVSDNIEKNLKDFKKFHFLYMWIVIWWCAALLCCYQPFIEIWQGKENMLPFSTVILFVIYFFTYKMGDVNWMYREALGLWWEARFIPLVSSIVNLILNIALVKVIGLNGILLSTIISLTVVNLPWSSLVTFKNYFKSMKEYRKYLFRTTAYLFVMVLVSGTSYILCEIIPFERYLKLFVCVIISAFLPNILLLLFNFKTDNFKDSLVLVRATPHNFPIKKRSHGKSHTTA